jgi:hypothetical protein
MPGQWLAAATPKGSHRAEVRKSDRQPARVGRDVASAEADQALQGPKAIPGGSTPGAVPERHRGLVPHAGPTGSARSATDAQAVHAGPAAARWQAPGGWAGLACKQRPVRERVGGGTRTPAPQSRRQSQPGTGARAVDGHCRSVWGRAAIGGQATGRGRAARGGGCRVRITSDRCRARARGWRHGQALARRDGVDDDAATRMRRVLCVPAVAGTMVTRSRLQGLRSCDFGGSMPPRVASWSLLAHRQCGPAARALQRRNSPIGEPMAKGPRNRLGLTGRCSTSGSDRARADRLPAPGSDIRDALQVQPWGGARFAV